MAKKIILKLADIQVYSDVSDNFDTDRLARFAIRVQEQQLRELLGDSFYKALYDDLDASGVPQNAPYTVLVNGESYKYDSEDVDYYGLKPFLVFHWLALNIKSGDVYMADYGNIVFTDNPQDNMTKVSKGTIDNMAADFMKSVTSYRNNIVQYLNTDPDNKYSLWKGKAENKNKSQFNSFVV